MKFKLKMNRDQVLEKAVWAVDYAKKHGVQVEFSAEDATRSEIGFMKEVFRAVSESGADRLDIPDTVGYSTPDYISRLVADVIAISQLPRVTTSRTLTLASISRAASASLNATAADVFSAITRASATASSRAPARYRSASMTLNPSMAMTSDTPVTSRADVTSLRWTGRRANQRLTAGPLAR